MVLVTAWIVYISFTPIIFYDQWTVVSELMQSNGHLSLAQLWALHNEHRIPWNKLACYLDLKVFGGRNVSLLVEIYAIQAMAALLFIWIFRKYSGLNRAAIMTASGLFAFCMFYPLQIENFYWGFQVAFVTLPFAASVSIWTAIMHSEVGATLDRPPWFSWWLAASLASAFVAETSLASGMLLWPLLLLLSFILRMPAKTKCLIAAVGAVATGIYLRGFHSPGQTSDPLDSLRHPVAVGRYITAYFAWSLDSARPSATLWPNFTHLCVMVAIGIVVTALLRLMWRGSKPDRLHVFLVANAIFLLMTSFVTALGRITLGLDLAASSRYQTVALAFWASLGALLILWRTAKARTPVRLLEIQVVLLLLLLASIPRSYSSALVAKGHQAALTQAYAAFIQNPSDSQAHANVSPYPDLAQAHAYLQSHHLGVPDREFHVLEGFLAPISLSPEAQLKVKGFEVESADQCVGYLDWVKPVSDKPEVVKAAGWAWTFGSAPGPRRIILALEDGTVVGSGQVTLPRPDVRQTVARVTELNTGWTAEGSLPPGRIMRAFIVSDRSTTVCPLPDEFRRK